MSRSILTAALAGLVLLFALGCASEPQAEKPPQDRDGFSGQMGVAAGDINDYGN